MGIIKDIKSYLYKVGRHWWSIVVVVVAAILNLIERLIWSANPEFLISAWVYIAIVFSGLMISQFLVWRDMRNERDSIRTYDVLQDTLNKLALKRDELIEFQNRPVTSDTEFGEWKVEFGALREKIIEILANEVNPAESRLYAHIGIFPNYPVPTFMLTEDANKEYENWRSRAIRDHKHLTSLILDYGRHKARIGTL